MFPVALAARLHRARQAISGRDAALVTSDERRFFGFEPPLLTSVSLGSERRDTELIEEMGGKRDGE